MSDDWDDEDTTATAEEGLIERATPSRSRACLTVLTGQATGQVFKLTGGGPALIGRAHTAEVRLVDDGVSRHHARLRLESDQLWVDDLESRNGTFVNGAADPRIGRAARRRQDPGRPHDRAAVRATTTSSTSRSTRT